MAVKQEGRIDSPICVSRFEHRFGRSVQAVEGEREMAVWAVPNPSAPPPKEFPERLADVVVRQREGTGKWVLRESVPVSEIERSKC